MQDFKTQKEIYQDRVQRIEKRISEKDLRILISVCYNNAGHVLSKLADTSSNPEEIADAYDQLARAFYNKHIGFLAELEEKAKVANSDETRHLLMLEPIKEEINQIINTKTIEELRTLTTQLKEKEYPLEQKDYLRELLIKQGDKLKAVDING